MTDIHDPLCSEYGSCRCDLIAKVRADERDQASRRMWDSYAQRPYAEGEYALYKALDHVVRSGVLISG